MASDPGSGNGDLQRGLSDGIDLALLEELRQPIAAASNYLGAARLLIAPQDHDFCKKALDQLRQAEKQLLRAGGIISRMRRRPATIENGPLPH
jgi:phosphoglycerate-specific signal transduction histidine kinase